jgi:hypothetical protein
METLWKAHQGIAREKEQRREQRTNELIRIGLLLNNVKLKVYLYTQKQILDET